MRGPPRDISPRGQHYVSSISQGAYLATTFTTTEDGGQEVEIVKQSSNFQPTPLMTHSLASRAPAQKQNRVPGNVDPCRIPEMSKKTDARATAQTQKRLSSSVEKSHAPKSSKKPLKEDTKAAIMPQKRWFGNVENSHVPN